MLPDIRAGLAALALETGAWSGLTLLDGRPDAALASFLLLHALASVLLALALLPLVPPRMATPRLGMLALMAAVAFAIPVAGFLGLIAAFPILTRQLVRHRVADFESLQLPEFDQDQRRPSQLRYAGLRTFLGQAAVPVPTRVRAMATLRHVSARTAAPLLRDALGDPSEELRLLAYGMLDNLEKRVNRAIAGELHAFEAAAPGSAPALQSAERLSDLYWELVYEELAQGDLRTHAIDQSLHYADSVLQHQPGNAALHLRRGRLLAERGQVQEAAQALERARTLGLPATRILPYLAQLRFEQRDFGGARALMRELDQWGALPRLRPVIDYWNRS